MVFTDRYDHVIDDKNRLAIPSQIRNAMSEQSNNSFYIVPEGRYLQLLPESLFQQLSAVAHAGLTVSADLAKARRLLFATASRLEWDKAGRVVVPDRYLKGGKSGNDFGEAILTRQVTLVGVGDRVEVWNTQDFTAHLRELIQDRPAVQAATQQVFGHVPASGAGQTT